MTWPILDSLPETEARELLTVARRRRFARGEVVFHADDPADTIHLVVSGRFAARVQTPLGDTAIFTIVGSGGYFGEIALLGAEQRRTATVEALEAGETRSILRADFDALRARHPEIDAVLMIALRETVERLSRHLLEALYVPAEKRIRRRLVELARVYGDDGAIVIPLRQTDIAGLAGSSRATVNRVLRGEERRGTIRLARGKIELIDAAELERRGR